MSFLASAQVGAMSLYQEMRHCGVAGRVALEDRVVVTQNFNFLSRRERSGLAIVSLPRFASVPNAVAPGAVKEVAAAHKADYVRFYHPDLLSDPARITYQRMVEDASGVVQSLPHKRIVLAGASVGSGMMPLVAEAVNAQEPGKVVAMFGWVSVPPAALLDLFRKQEGWADVHAGRSEVLHVSSSDLSQPFSLTRTQCRSVEAYEERARHLKPFNGPVVLFAGSADTVGRPEFSEQMLQQMNPPVTRFELVKCGHKMPSAQIRRGLHMLLKQI